MHQEHRGDLALSPAGRQPGGQLVEPAHLLAVSVQPVPGDRLATIPVEVRNAREAAVEGVVAEQVGRNAVVEPGLTPWEGFLPLRIAAEHQQVTDQQRRARLEEGAQRGGIRDDRVEDPEEELDRRSGLRGVVLEVGEEAPIAGIVLGQQADEQDIAAGAVQSAGLGQSVEPQDHVGRRAHARRFDVAGGPLGGRDVPRGQLIRRPLLEPRRSRRLGREARQRELGGEVGLHLLGTHVQHPPGARGLVPAELHHPADRLGAHEQIDAPELVYQVVPAGRVRPGRGRQVRRRWNPGVSHRSTPSHSRSSEPERDAAAEPGDALQLGQIA